MPSKKKARSAKPAKKTAAKRPPAKSAKKAVKRSARPAAKRAAARGKASASAPKPKIAGVDPEIARRMAAFSSQVTKEEEAPVAVRSFNEARAGIQKSQELNVKTGQAKPVKPLKGAPPPSAPPIELEAEADADEDEIDVDEELAEVTKGMEVHRPKMEPLTGPLAVPKAREPEEFKLAAPPPKGKKGALPTKDDLGRIELRMQRGTKDEKIAEANPDYLQRSFNKAAERGKVAATTGQRGEHEEKAEEFEVAMDKSNRKVDASLLDFGDVEIAQQTRKGSRKVGKLDADKDED